MPTRKQKRRDLKSKRHDYEFVYVDGEGNELEELPPEFAEEPKERTNGAKNGAKPAAAPAKKQQTAQRGRRQPPQPSWSRALRRGGLLGLVVLVLFSLSAKGHIATVIPLALLYTALFIPFTYYIDRFAYKRWEARQQTGGAKPASRPAKKR
jgi:hypothetical protein